MPAIQYPQFNGNRFSFASCEFRFAGLWLIGVKSLNYKPSLKAGIVRGTNPNPIGRTAGEAEYTWDAEMLTLEWDALRDVLSAGGSVGYGETPFLIAASFAELGSPVDLHQIQSARIEEADASNASGPDASMVKLSGTALRILHNGASIVTPRAGAL